MYDHLFPVGLNETCTLKKSTNCFTGPRGTLPSHALVLYDDVNMVSFDTEMSCTVLKYLLLGGFVNDKCKKRGETMSLASHNLLLHSSAEEIRVDHIQSTCMFMFILFTDFNTNTLIFLWQSAKLRVAVK